MKQLYKVTRDYIKQGMALANSVIQNMLNPNKNAALCPVRLVSKRSHFFK